VSGLRDINSNPVKPRRLPPFNWKSCTSGRRRLSGSHLVERELSVDSGGLGRGLFRAAEVLA